MQANTSLFLLQLPGLNRYDVSICKINTNCISNWQRYKSKLDLSADECKRLYNEVKSKLNIKVEERKSQNSINLIFSKPLANEPFNDLFREFIKNNKICGQCNIPELVDKHCKACGFDSTKSTKSSGASDKEDTKKEKISKADKRALKIAKQKESSNKTDKDTTDESEEKQEAIEDVVEEPLLKDEERV